MSEDHASLVTKLQHLQEHCLEKAKRSDSTIAEMSQTIEMLRSSQTEENELASLREENITLKHAKTTNEKTIETLSHEKQNLIALITTKHTENVQYHNEIQRLNQLLQNEIEKNAKAISCTECSTLKEKLQQVEEQAAKLDEFDKLVDQNQFLKEKADILTNNLIAEQNNQKILNQEKLDMADQVRSLNRELERLRQHLLDMEESHTQETVELQEMLQETKAKLVSIEEEAKKSCNAYTSAR
jgi:hypothetical protein